MRTKVQSATIQVVVPATVKAYLQDLASLGVYGSTPAEVVRTMVLREIERTVVKEQLVPLRRARADQTDGESPSAPSASGKRAKKTKV